MTLLRTLRFDQAFDGRSWPDPLAAMEAEAVFGRAHVGPKRLLALLELQLGLGGPAASHIERVAALVPILVARLATGDALDPPFYAKSFEVDALGTAERLLQLRDRLALAGFDGSPQHCVSPRLQTLAEATAERLPGVAERLQRIMRTLPGRTLDIGVIELCEEASALPLLWQRLFARLAAQGVNVQTLAPHGGAPGDDDLAVARAALAGSTAFAARGDGSLTLLRSAGPLAAARAVAAVLAQRETLEGVVIIGGDRVLDDALAAQGLPRLGASHANALRAVLPTAIQLGWQPPAPELAQALLLTPDGPVPGRVARALSRALSRVPAVDSDGWRAARTDALAAVAALDEGAAAKSTTLLDTLFTSRVPRRGARERSYPRVELERRLACIEAWARGRAHRDERAPEAPAFFGVLEQCRLLRATLELLRQTHFSAPELRRLLSLVDDGTGGLGGEAEAGLFAVRQPDAIVGEARCVVWWSFTRKSAPAVPRALVNRSEQAALAQHGIALPEAGSEATRLARRWMRPLNAAREQLLLVCPRRGDDGEEASPHPLWDELEARSDAVGLHALIVSAPQLERVPVTLAPPPAARRQFTLRGDRPVALRAAESPSSLELLGGCPLAWVLRYHAELDHGVGDPLRGFGARERGTLAHELLSRLLRDVVEPPAPDETVTRLGELFDHEGPRLAAALFLPGHEAERADVRQRLLAAGRVLVEHLQQHAARLRSSEVAYERSGLGTTLRGRPDLVLSDPPAVIDFKWGSRARHEASLRAGTAVQLALYAWLVGGSEPVTATLPQLAYFILRSQDLLVDGDRPLLGGQGVGSDIGGAVGALPALFARLEARRAELAAGNIEAAGVATEATAAADHHELVGDELTLAAPCHFCSFGVLCARALQRGEVVGEEAAHGESRGGERDA